MWLLENSLGYRISHNGKNLHFKKIISSLKLMFGERNESFLALSSIYATEIAILGIADTCDIENSGFHGNKNNNILW